MLMQVCRCSAFVPEGHIAKACNWQCKRKREQYTGSCSIACERILVADEIPRGVCGSCLHIQIAWLHYVVQRVLRALPAETKVDGLPRASSLWIPMSESNEIKCGINGASSGDISGSLCQN